MIVGVDIRSFHNQHVHEFKSPNITRWRLCMSRASHGQM